VLGLGQLSFPVRVGQRPSRALTAWTKVRQWARCFLRLHSGQAEPETFAGRGLEADVGDEVETVVAGFVAEEMPGAIWGVEYPAARLPDIAQFAVDKLGDGFLEELVHVYPPSCLADRTETRKDSSRKPL